MSKISCVVTGSKGLYEDEEIYDIQPVSELSELLKEGFSLCLTSPDGHFMRSFELGEFWSLRGTWIKPDGNEEKTQLYLTRDGEKNQSTGKQRLIKIFQGKFLFTSWKKSGIRRFQVCKGHRILAEYDKFEDAIADLIPGKFVPKGIYIRKYNWITMLGLTVKRTRERSDLRNSVCSMLSQYADKKEQHANEN